MLTIDAIDLPDASIWGLATGQRDLGQIVISGVHGTITREADGTTNLQRALEPTGTAPPPPPVGPSTTDSAESGLPMELAFSLEVRDVDLQYEQPGTDRTRRSRQTAASRLCRLGRWTASPVRTASWSPYWARPSTPAYVPMGGSKTRRSA